MQGCSASMFACVQVLHRRATLVRRQSLGATVRRTRRNIWLQCAVGSSHIVPAVEHMRLPATTDTQKNGSLELQNTKLHILSSRALANGRMRIQRPASSPID